MRVFVTGATGVIGRRLVPLLVRMGNSVTAVARSSASRDELRRNDALPIEVELFDPRAVARVIAGHDVVINLATHIPRSGTALFLRRMWRENDRLRRVASAAIVDACIAADVARLIQESFAPVYPDNGERWIHEDVPLSPVRYNLTITDAEASATRYTEAGRIGIVLRFGSFYGPDAVQTSDLIAWVRHGWAPLPGPPEAYISSVAHDDAARAVAAAMSLPSGAYNVVDDEAVSHRMFVDSLADALDVERPNLPPKWITPMLGSLGDMLARSIRVSNRKLRSASTWRPKYPSVRDGWRAVLSEIQGVSRTAA